MISVDSIYERIVSSIEKDLPISVRKPQRRRQVSPGVNNAEKTEGTSASAKQNFEAVLGSVTASSSSVKVIDPRSIMTRIEAAVINAAKKYNVDYALIKGVIKAESSFDPSSVSHAGAMGLMQLMPSNCTEYGVTDPFNIEQNVDAGTRHLRDMINRYDGDVSLGLAAYNAGPGNVEKYGGIPPFEETQNYVPKVLKYMDEFKNG